MDPNTDDDTLALPPQPIEEDAVQLRVDLLSWPQELEGESDMWATSVRRSFDEARDVFEQFTAIRSLNAKNEKLTVAGAHAANKEWAEKNLPTVAKKLEEIRAQSTRIDDQIKRMSDEVAKPAEEPADIALLAEIRTWLRTMPEGDRNLKIDFLVRHGDTTALRAVLTAPAYLTGVDESLMALIRDDVARKANPERYAKIEKLRKGLVATERAFEGVHRLVVQETSDAALQRMETAKLRITSLQRTHAAPPRPRPAPPSPEVQARIDAALETALAHQRQAG